MTFLSWIFSGPFSWTNSTPAYGLLEAAGHRHARDRAIGVVGKAMPRQHVQLVANEARGSLERCDVRVGQSDVQPARAKIAAQARPINPAPTMATFLQRWPC